MENIIANVAQFDNDVRTERAVNGSRDAMREGRYVWHAPFGYKNVKIGGKSTIAKDENSIIVQKVFEEIAKNYCPVDKVRQKLFKEGFATKSGKMFNKSFYYRMLNNEVYQGWIVKFGERHKGLYEPIVSEELYAQVQRILKRRRHRSSVYRRENPDFPLRRFVQHTTGKKLTGAWSKGRNCKYPYYRFVSISNSLHKKDIFEGRFVDFLRRFSIQEQHLMDFKKALMNALDKTLKEEKKDYSVLCNYERDLHSRQTSLIEKNQKGIISDSILRRQLDQIEEEMINIQSKLYSMPNRQIDIGELLDFAAEYLRDPGKVWEKASYKQRIELQWFVFPNGVIFENGNFRTTKIASIFKAKNLFLGPLSPNVGLRGRNYEPANNDKPTSIPFENLQQYAVELSRLAEILRSDAE